MAKDKDPIPSSIPVTETPISPSKPVSVTPIKAEVVEPENQGMKDALAKAASLATPPTPIPVKPVKAVPLTEQQKEKAAVLARITACQKEFDGESNIPTNHDYWAWLNKLRSLSNPN